MAKNISQFASQKLFFTLNYVKCAFRVLYFEVNQGGELILSGVYVLVHEHLNSLYNAE